MACINQRLTLLDVFISLLCPISGPLLLTTVASTIPAPVVYLGYLLRNKRSLAVSPGAKASQSRVQDSDSDDGEMKTDMKRAQEKQLQDAYEEIACILKGNQESGNTFFDFMGSGAALGVINDVIDLVPAACYDDGGESRGKAAKAAIRLLIPFVFAAYWWCRRAKVH